MHRSGCQDAGPDALALLPGEAGAGARGGDAILYGLRPGQEASAARAFAQADLDEYITLTGDANPYHADPAFARARGFGGRGAAAAAGAMFSDLLGTRLPDGALGG